MFEVANQNRSETQIDVDFVDYGKADGYMVRFLEQKRNGDFDEELRELRALRRATARR